MPTTHLDTNAPEAARIDLKAVRPADAPPAAAIVETAKAIYNVSPIFGGGFDVLVYRRSPTIGGKVSQHAYHLLEGMNGHVMTNTETGRTELRSGPSRRSYSWMKCEDCYMTLADALKAVAEHCR